MVANALFLRENMVVLAPEWKQQMHNLLNDEQSYDSLSRNHKKYKDMDNFLKSVK